MILIVLLTTMVKLYTSKKNKLKKLIKITVQERLESDKMQDLHALYIACKPQEHNVFF
jgi:hypothetical protein